MKARNLFLSVAVLFCSCTKTENIALLSTVGNTSKSNVISASEALTNLDNELRSIYGTNTRSAVNMRKVKTINYIDFKGTRTKNGDTECPFYIVEFEDNKGSAILSADNRVEPVLAILDNDVLTESDFASNDLDEIKPYIASLIRQYADNSLNASGLEIRPIEPGGGIDTIYHYVRKPLIKTKWHQRSPYNDLCIIPGIYDDYANAGCTVIATSQLVKFHKYPAIINSQSFDWNLLDLCDYGANMIEDARIEVARFVYNIGCLNGGINYSINDSDASLLETGSSLKAMGYKNVNTADYSDSTLRNLIFNNSKPVIISGTCANIYDGAHSWLLDGWNEYKIKNKKMLIDGTSQIVYTTTTKVHCNFGYAGSCDGYYTSGVFDTTKSLSPGDIDSKIGDKADTGSNYNSNLCIIVYDLP